jgi:hypothetical protein
MSKEIETTINWEFPTLKTFINGNYWHNPEDAIGDIRKFITNEENKATEAASGLNDLVSWPRRWGKVAERITELEEKISPCHSIPLEDFLGPLKPCPFCGSENLFNDDGMAIICRNCEATAPVSGWQFRAPAGAV